MAVTPGDRLGSYEIVALIGSGGMGEVYRARDAKLNRDVALKVLPEHFATDPERLARFKREAQVLASLNHPNVGAIYGLEDGGGVYALVLELIEGPTLADRITQGRIPLDEALPIATEIAESLEAARRTGGVLYEPGWAPPDGRPDRVERSRSRRRDTCGALFDTARTVRSRPLTDNGFSSPPRRSKVPQSPLF
jgi:serine/threonine protein kinase